MDEKEVEASSHNDHSDSPQLEKSEVSPHSSPKASASKVRQKIAPKMSPKRSSRRRETSDVSYDGEIPNDVSCIQLVRCSGVDEEALRMAKIERSHFAIRRSEAADPVLAPKPRIGLKLGEKDNISPNKSPAFRSVEYVKENVPGLTEHLNLVKKIGEGTFATVYLAESRSEPPIPFALKALVPTVHTSRIENELKLLAMVGGRQNVIRLLSAWRFKDHVFLLMPYVEHERFTDYFLTLGVPEVRQYMRNLLIALRHLHFYAVVHRDVKPSNFLFNRKRNLYALVDFGLAHLEKSRRRSSETKKRPEMMTQLVRPSLGASTSAVAASGSLVGGQCRCGDRPVICRVCLGLPAMGQGAARGGTCGYRAPEVVMRCPEQTVAIDVWSAGMIFASFIAGRCPPLYSTSDNDYLHKVVFLCGLERMQAAAWQVSRRLVVVPAPPPDDSPSYADRLRCRLTAIRRKIRQKAPEGASAAVPVAPPDLEFPTEAFSLLARMLDPNPRTRISARETLRHPFFTAPAVGGKKEDLASGAAKEK